MFATLRGWSKVPTCVAALAISVTTGVAVASDADATGRSTSEACERVGDAAATVQRQLDALERDLAQALTQARADITRELAPMMRDWADRLRALARELEQSRAGRDS